MEWECNNNNMTMLWKEKRCGAKKGFENARGVGKVLTLPSLPFFVHTHTHTHTKFSHKTEKQMPLISLIFRI